MLTFFILGLSHEEAAPLDSRARSNEKNPGCLGCKKDDTTQYMGILISQNQDPYKPTSIMESKVS